MRDKLARMAQSIFAGCRRLSEFPTLPTINVTQSIRFPKAKPSLGGHHQRMASRTFVELVDDLEGGPADESVSFALDGREYEIDLSTANAKKLRSALDAYQAVARRVTGRSRGRAAGAGAASTGDAAAIREWAVSNGYEVSSRGRIPAQLREAYEAR